MCLSWCVHKQLITMNDELESSLHIMCQLTAHSSLVTAHCSQLTAHSSLLQKINAKSPVNLDPAAK